MVLNESSDRKFVEKHIMVEEVRENLKSMCDVEYRKFHSRLLPGTENIIGVRIPEIRKLAKKIVKEDWRFYLNAAPDTYYEEDMLRGFIIGYAKMDLDERLKWITQFLPSIHNWAVCDCFCATLKFTKTHMNDMWNYIEPLFSSEDAYTIRFASVMALDYFVFSEYASKVFGYFDMIKNKDYYVQMGVAWAISIYYITLPEVTEAYLKQNCLDDFTHNKAIQKICESYRVNQDTKVYLRSLKR